MDKCNVCHDLNILSVQAVDDLAAGMMDLLDCFVYKSICIIADDSFTKEFLYYAVNEPLCVIQGVHLEDHEYNGPYYILLSGSDEEYHVHIKCAMNGGKLLPLTSEYMVIQLGLQEEYKQISSLIDSTETSGVKCDFFVVGDDLDLEFYDEYEFDEDGDEGYRFEATYDGNDHFAEIKIKSDIKDFVEMLKDFCRNYFYGE